jgi:hypothetical protein
VVFPPLPLAAPRAFAPPEPELNTSPVCASASQVISDTGETNANANANARACRVHDRARRRAEKPRIEVMQVLTQNYMPQ